MVNSGIRCPPWIGVSVAGRPPSPPGRLATPSVDDLASLVLRRCYDGLQSGRSAVSVQAAVALIRLAHEIEHDAALAERDAARRQMEEWRHGLWIIRNAIVRQYGQDAWAAISAEVRKLRPAAPRLTGSRAGVAGGYPVPRRPLDDHAPKRSACGASSWPYIYLTARSRRSAAWSTGFWRSTRCQWLTSVDGSVMAATSRSRCAVKT